MTATPLSPITLTSPTTPPIATPDGENLARIKQYNDAARHHSAWRLAQEYAPLTQWEGPAARREASRIAAGLGNYRLSRALSILNYRKHPEDEEAFFSFIAKRVDRLGPLTVEEILNRRLGTHPNLSGLHRADLLAFKALLLALLRDFTPAHEAIKSALELAPEEPWVRAQHSSILEAEDRYAEALEVARHAVSLGPNRLSCVMQLVDCLIHLGRDEEACAALTCAHEESETAQYAERLVNFYSEREDHERALFYLDEHDRRAFQMDKHGREWSLRRRADLLFIAGDYDGCLKACDQLPEESYHRRVAANMRLPGAREKKRKRLDVPFVRQHSMTCAPATLAALAAYWKLEFDHLAISEAICHHGTPWHKERQWAEENGFIASEFRLTREIAIALLDREIPFTLSTESVTNAHLQACIGYDERQGTLLLRDPTERHFGEVLLEGLIETHPIQGPRCMLLLPKAEEHRLAGLTLPDTESYDAYHHYLLAIDRHDRESACAAVASMAEGTPMRLWAELALAGYDRNPSAEYARIEQLTSRFPESASLRYYRLRVVQRLRDFARERELLAAELRQKHCDPVFYSEMGELLMRDARHFALADYYLRKAIRLSPGTAQVYANLAYCRRKERRFEEAARYHRAAASLEQTFEQYASDYADSCRAIGRPEEGLAFLRQRVRQQGEKANGPWFTLIDELTTQGLGTEAVACLEEALAARPEDGGMLLGAGKRFLYSGDPQRAEALINQARGKIREADWLSETAWLSTTLGRRQEAIGSWRAHLRLEPHAIPGHRAMARLLAEEEGEEAALKWLCEATAAMPGNPALWDLRAEWEATEHGPTAAIASLQRSLELNPDSTWTLREIAIRQFRAGHVETAFGFAREAIQKDPYSPDGYRILGFLQEEHGKIGEATLNYRSCLSISIDDTEAAGRLLDLASTRQERLEVLTFIEGEMRRQVSNGDIVPQYRTLAYRHLEPAALLKKLREFCNIRPDLWQTWSARLEQALDMDLPEEAMICAQALTGRFPLLPRAWSDLAMVHQVNGRYEEEIAALQHAISLSPGWDWAHRILATALERVARYDEAEATLEKALLRDPLTGANYGCLSDLLWKRGKRVEAFEQLLRGMHHCPTYSWGWETLSNWANVLDRGGELVALLNEHEPLQGQYPGWWIRHSDALHGIQRLPEALATLEKGLQRHPRHPLLLEQQTHLLVIDQQFDEAVAVSREATGLYPENRLLAGRHAWVLMKTGAPREAIARMTALVESQPDYLWAISQLCDWLREREEWAKLRKQSDSWIRLEPQNSKAYGFLAQACLNLDDRAAGKAAYLKAYTLDPQYAYAGRQLLSLQIEDKEFEAAGQTLRTLEHYAASAMIRADAVELAVGIQDAKEAERRASALLEAEDVSVDLLEWMPALFAKLGKERRWWKLLDRAAARPAPHPAIIATWVRSLRPRKRLFKAPWRLGRLRSPAAQEAKVQGWIALLDAATPQMAFRYRYWIWRRRDWLRSRNDLWSAAGNALTECQHHRRASQWFADWKERRDDLSCLTLFNCGVTLEDAKGWNAAFEVREYALRRFPHTQLSPPLRATVALGHAMRGEIAQANALASEVEPGELTPFYKHYYTLAQSLIDAAAGKEEAAASGYQKALNALNEIGYDRGVASVLSGAQAQLARVLPWADGKPEAIAKTWGRYRSFRFWEHGTFTYIRYFLFLAFILHILLKAIFTET